MKNIKIPKGWRLLKAEVIFLYNNKKYRKILNMWDTWEFIEQPFEINKENYVARFVADSDGADLACYRNPRNSNDSLGVRFVRDLTNKIHVKEKERRFRKVVEWKWDTSDRELFFVFSVILLTFHYVLLWTNLLFDYEYELFWVLFTLGLIVFFGLGWIADARLYAKVYWVENDK